MQIDKELGWAEAMGMNTMRVFLHDLLWQQDAPGFRKRIDKFLTIASRHHIRPLFVLFDSCWDPVPKLGPQHAPVPGVHNSGWVQSPGAKALADPSQYPRLKEYVLGVVGAFAKDDRILGWDVWNEPGSFGGGDYAKTELKHADKTARVMTLLPQAFAWAREANPSQPLTSGVWDIDTSKDESAAEGIQSIQLRESDVITFHNYSWPEDFKAEIAWLRRFHRPVICTEYMARSVGSTFDGILPIAKQERVGAINWGFVAGKTQTYYPWESWDHPYVKHQPPVWFHEVLHPDGTPYRQGRSGVDPAADGDTVRLTATICPVAPTSDNAQTFHHRAPRFTGRVLLTWTLTLPLQSRHHEKSAISLVSRTCLFHLPHRMQQIFVARGLEFGFFRKGARRGAAEAAGICRSRRHRLRTAQRAGYGRSIEGGRRLRGAIEPGEASVLCCVRHAGNGDWRRGQCGWEAVHSAVARDGSVGRVDQRRLPVTAASRFEWTRHLLRAGRYGIDGRRTCGGGGASGNGESTRCGHDESTRRRDNDSEVMRLREIPEDGGRGISL